MRTYPCKHRKCSVQLIVWVRGPICSSTAHSETNVLARHLVVQSVPMPREWTQVLRLRLNDSVDHTEKRQQERPHCDSATDPAALCTTWCPAMPDSRTHEARSSHAAVVDLFAEYAACTAFDVRLALPWRGLAASARGLNGFPTRERERGEKQEVPKDGAIRKLEDVRPFGRCFCRNQEASTFRGPAFGVLVTGLVLCHGKGIVKLEKTIPNVHNIWIWSTLTALCNFSQFPLCSICLLLPKENGTSFKGFQDNIPFTRAINHFKEGRLLFASLLLSRSHLDAVCLERRLPAKHLEERDTAAPNVALLGVATSHSK